MLLSYHPLSMSTRSSSASTEARSSLALGAEEAEGVLGVEGVDRDGQVLGLAAEDRELLDVGGVHQRVGAALLPKLAAFAPDLVLVSAGFDGGALALLDEAAVRCAQSGIEELAGEWRATLLATRTLLAGEGPANPALREQQKADPRLEALAPFLR